MAVHALSSNFEYFFWRLNPSPSFIKQAASEHENIRSLIENPNGPARELSPRCFLQGSYKQDTAIDRINDIDIVVLCELWQPGYGNAGGRSFGRNEIFNIVASSITANNLHKSKVRYNDGSMCIKVDLGIKVEILPVVFKQNNYDFHKEPFRLYRPEKQQWEDGYARYHQNLLSWKNSREKTNGNFKPAIKVFKHLRSLFNIDAVSFHIESFLYNLPDSLYLGNPPDYITNILNFIIKWDSEEWYKTDIKTPCGDRSIFTTNEWEQKKWLAFYEFIQLASRAANIASASKDISDTIKMWQLLLGENYFPKKVN